MVGMTKTSREKISSRINFVKHGDLPAKLAHLRRLRDELAAADSMVVEEFISPIVKFQSDSSSPVRRLVTQIISEVSMKHLNLLPEVIPALIRSLKDETPAVARQAILSGVDLFRSALAKIAAQGSYSGEVSQSLKSSWEHLLRFRDETFSMAFKVGSDGTRLPALKFVERIVLLYTPDPNGSLEPPSDQFSEGNVEEFNVSWLRSGHQILNVGDLSAEASQSLSLLLDQLRFPSLKSHNYLIIIVLIKSLLEVAIKRPAFYGRILPVLLGLDPSVSSSKGVHLTGVRHALRKAFESCLSCTHSGASPWRARLVSALKDVTVATSAVQKSSEEVIGNNERVHQQGDLLSTQIRKDEKSPLSAAIEHSNSGTKRIGDFPDSEMSVKRAKSTSENSEGSVRELSESQERSPSSDPTASRSDSDNGPVQQLVSMFGVLVAQGDKAATSLEILISSISADLLSEVVMANMRNLPLNNPTFEQIEDSHSSMGAYPDMSDSDAHLRHLSLLLEDRLAQSTHLLKKEEGMSDSHQPASELMVTQEEELPNATDSDIVHDGLTYSSQQVAWSMNESDVVPSSLETAYATFTPDINDVEVGDNDIPGLSFSTQDQNLPESSTDFSKGSSDLDNANLEMLTTLDHTPIQLAQSLSTVKSEELSPKAEATEATSTPSETPTSVGLSSQFVLPKISAPILNLRDDEKDHLQEIAFMRIVDAYKQVSVAGGSEARFSILAHSGMEFPPELDPWKLLRAHILSDYVNHEGHELTLRVLYRLFGEAEDHDFFSSTAATSVYETFLIQVAETLRVSFPATDKSLGRLLSEVPNLPKSIFEMLECLCCPGGSDSDDKELRSGDRVTQGLSTVWSLILLRPPIRDACLKIALKSAVHLLEEVRMKAIRLVANKLYPLSFVSQKIEDFAEKMLLSVGIQDQKSLTKGTDGLHHELQKDENLSTDNLSVNFPIGDISINDQEVQRGMSLYFALCTKKHSLIQKIFDVYDRTSEVAKQVIRRQIPLLVRTIGSSPDLLDIIADPPTGSEGLVIQVVHTLTEGTVPSSELVSSVMRLFNSKLRDLDILIPLLPFVHRDEVLRLFPQIVNAPLDKFQVALSRALQGLNNSSPVLTPAEALIAIHGIDPDRDGIPLKKVTDACNACFEQRNIFTQQVLAKVLNQLVEQIPLPLLFMRTVLQAIGAFPALVEFIMEILSRLVNKQIWKYPKLWVGFLKCALLTKPQSFGVLLQLPSAQLENALNRTPALRPPLVAHADQPHIRASLPRSTLVVLGLASESEAQPQTSAPPPPPPPQAPPTTITTETQTTAEANNSEKEAAAATDIVSKESSSSLAD